MMSFAEMGCSQLPPPPRWNTSTTAVYEFEDPVPYEDEERAALTFSGSQSQRGLLDSAIEGEDDADFDGAEMLPRDPARMKRRWSTRFGDALADFGKVVKKRTDSWRKRKDSVASPVDASDPAPEVLVGERSSGLDPSASPSRGSGGRSRDGDDELSSEEDLLRFTSTASRQRQPSQADDHGQTRPERQVQYAYPAEQLRRAAAAGEQDIHGLVWRLQNEEEQRRLHRHPREHLAMMERELRIAERQGAFTDAAFEKKFKKAHRRLKRADSEQSQASIKLKAKVARKKSESDGKFRRWSETKDLSPMSRVLKRIGRRNRADSAAEEESEVRSEMPRSEEDEDENARSRGSVASLESQASTDEWREGNVEAARFAGWALQSAPYPF